MTGVVTVYLVYRRMEKGMDRIKDREITGYWIDRRMEEGMDRIMDRDITGSR
jgi:hypothetical protein